MYIQYVLLYWSAMKQWNLAVRGRERVRDGGEVGIIQHHANPASTILPITFWTPSIIS